MTITAPRSRAATRTAITLAGHVAILTAILAALWYLSGSPFPRSLPSWTSIQAQWRGIEIEPSQIIYPLLRLLADLLWVVWAWYALWFVLALLWSLLRLPTTTVPGALAAVTPAIALRAISLGTLAASSTVPVGHTPATTMSSSLAAATTHTPTSPAAAPAQSPLTVDTVKAGDNLWDIAGEYYHQPTDWKQIYDANQGVRQPDGEELTNPALIRPGWRLTIPALTTTDASSGAHHSTTTARPAPNRAPGSATPKRPAHAPGRATQTPATRPAPTGRPHTVGYDLPEAAGYTGITLITAIAAAVALLRTRNRRRGLPSDHEVPDLARTLAAVHSAADSADAYGYSPDEHPGETPPPLLTDPPGHPVLGTSEDQQQEAVFDPDRLPGPLALTGPGATNVARALAISTLATEGNTLATDPELIGELLGRPREPDQPCWISTTTSEDEPDEGHVQQSPRTVIRVPKPDTDYPPGTVLLGRPDTEDAAVLEIEKDGTLRNSSGAGAEQYTGTHLHTLTRNAATELYTTLREARPAPPTDTDAEQAETEVAEQANEQTRREHVESANADPRTLTTTPLILRVLDVPDILGPTGVSTPIETEQATALLTLLALNPDGIRTRELRALEWPHAADDRPARVTLSKAITRVRTHLRGALTDPPDAGDPVQYDATAQAYRLNPAVITTDLALIRRLAHDAETEEADQKLVLLIQAASLHRGELSPRLDDNHRDWLTTARYSLLNEAANLHLRIADLAADIEPESAAHHLRQLANLCPEEHDMVTAALRVCGRLNDAGVARLLYERHREALRRIKEAPDPDVTQLVRTITSS